MEEVKYCVYIHINKDDNNKAYIGISKNPKKRWRSGEGYKGQPKFYYAIQKYGWNNFKHIILLKDLSLEEAWEKEKKYIKKYDTINDGYNVHEGGEIKLTPEMRKNGYVKKRFLETQVYIGNLKTLQVITYDTVKEASLKTGISEYWFYMYYKREVPMLADIDISFGLDSRTSASMIKLTKEREKEKIERQQKIEKMYEEYGEEIRKGMQKYKHVHQCP